MSGFKFDLIMNVMKPGNLLVLFFLPLVAAQGQDWKFFETEQIHQKRVESGRNYYPFLNESSFAMGLYELNAKVIDNQPVHDEDEVYFIVSGKAKLVAGDSTFDVAAGSIAFVRAGISHRFVEIEEDFSALVIFTKTPSKTGDADALAFELGKLRQSANPEENVWNQFLFVSSMRMGLYLLPLSLGGDQPLNHKVDEINIVTKGEGILVVGEEEIPVKAGTIVWVKEGNPHSFKNLSEDFDVLIAFHIKP